MSPALRICSGGSVRRDRVRDELPDAVVFAALEAAGNVIEDRHVSVS